MKSNKKVWFVTGASKGLGLALVQQLLKEGYPVAATSRSKEQLALAVGEVPDFFLPLAVDLTNEQSIAEAIQQTHQHFGGLDVVVNNAGYGIGGSLEELTDAEIRASFDVNVFATLSVIRHALPFLRAQHSGHIINISSIAGFAPAVGWAAYAATKFAISGLTEALAEELKPLGIKATVVSPGAFRTHFLTEDALSLPSHPIEAYEAVRASHARYKTMDGQQLGDPDKAAALFIQLAESEHPPVSLFIGSDAYSRAQQKVEAISANLEQRKDLTFSTDFTN